MKKTLILLFVAALGAGTMSSCNKSNKGKLSGEWTLASLNSTSSSTSGNPVSTSTAAVTISGSAVTREESYTVSGNLNSSTSNGVVNTATWNIEKDGTWTSVMGLTFTDNSNNGYTETEQSLETTSGTWSFVGKNKTADLGKNERVTMSTLASSSSNTNTYTPTGGSPVISNYSSSSTYAEGDNAATYLITESKKKDLTLTQVGASTSSSTYAGGTSTSSSTSNATVVLTQE